MFGLSVYIIWLWAVGIDVCQVHRSRSRSKISGFPAAIEAILDYVGRKW